MLHQSLFSTSFCSAIVYQEDLLADGPPDVPSIFCKKKGEQVLNVSQTHHDTVLLCCCCLKRKHMWQIRSN